MHACEKGSKDIVSMLLESKADPNIQNHEGETALMIASVWEFKEIIEILLSSGSNIDARNTYGETPLMRVCSNGNSEIANMLLKHGANPNAQDKSGYSSLMTACHSQNIEMVQLLLSDDRTNANLQDNLGEIALMKTLANQDIMQLLLQKDIQLDLQDAQGETSLMKACSNGYEDVVELLLSFGAGMECQNIHEETAFGIAIKKYGYDWVLQFFRKKAPLMNSTTKGACLIWASSKGFIDVVELLLSYRAKVDAQDKYGETALMKSISKKHTDVFDHLLKHKPDLNLENCDGWTALMLSCYKGSKEMVERLLIDGADLDHQNQKGWTAQSISKSYQQTEIERLLKNPKWRVKLKADLYFKDNEGKWNLLAFGGTVSISQKFIYGRKKEIVPPPFLLSFFF